MVIEFLAFFTMLVIPYRKGLIQLLAYIALGYLVFTHLLAQMEEPERETLKKAANVVTKAASRTAVSFATQIQEHWNNLTQA